MHKLGIGSCERKYHATRGKCNGRNTDLYDDISVTFRSDNFGHKLLLGRARHCHRREYGYTDSERYGNIHSDRDELGEWLHQLGIGSCGCEHHATRGKCNGRNIDLYDDVSFTFCGNDNGHEL